MKLKEKIKNKKEKYSSLLKKNERFLMPVFLFFGFIVDWFTLNRIDQIFDNLILLVYIILAALSIFILYGYYPILQRAKSFAPLLLQYAFGGLFSGLVIFYFRSSSILTSFPFLIILLVLFLGNDFLHKKYQRLLFQTSVLYVAIFSYSILVIPILFKRINTWTFILGSVLSLLIIHLFILFLRKVTLYEKFFKQIYKVIVAMFITFIVLYATNIIPPIPLSLKESYVAHEVKKIPVNQMPGGNEHTVISNDFSYAITLEKNPWYIFWSKYNRDLHIFNNEPVYVFSSVFAPTNLRSIIYHQWSYYDAKKNRWTDTDRIPIEIVGGQDGGFRGYSFKSNLEKGTWRVDIETKSDQVIGRILFEIKEPKDNLGLTKVFK